MNLIVRANQLQFDIEYNKYKELTNKGLQDEDKKVYNLYKANQIKLNYNPHDEYINNLNIKYLIKGEAIDKILKERGIR